MPRSWAEPRLKQMIGSLRCESFYNTGAFVDEQLGTYVAWQSQQGSFAGDMPVWNERRDVTLVFSGEEYTDPGTTSRLKEHGHSVDLEGPSYLAHLYEEDPSFPRSLNGVFHGVVIDSLQGAVTLFNDRYGMHRLYYHESREAFYFAAEAKAILEVCPELRVADPKGLGEFVSISCVLENRTIFQGIHVIPPASAWVFRSGQLERRATYFDPKEWEEQPPLEPEAYYQQLREAIARNLPRYFNGHQPVGITLTGGLDTRVVMALGKPAPRTFSCYTFGGMFRECQDVRIAREVAKVCQQPHEVISVGNEFLSRFPEYAERCVRLTEGGTDVSRCSDIYVSEKARAIAPVKVVGTYGSEIIRHAVLFKPVTPPAGLYCSDFLYYIDETRSTYAEVRRANPVTFAAFRQSPWYHRGVLWLEESQLTVRSPFLDNDFVKTVYRAPKSEDLSGDVRLRLVEDGNTSLAAFPTDMGIGGKSNRFASAATRFILEFLSRAEYAYDYGMPQWLARLDHPLSRLHLERLFLGRNKLLHFRIWYRDSLSKYIQEILLDPLSLSRPHIEKKGLETIVRGHCQGIRNYTQEIHKLLSLELLHRLFLDPR